MTASSGSVPDLSGVRLLTFDCYGTLVDWERGFIGAFARHVCPDYFVGQLSDVVEAWEAIQFELLAGEYRPYREILEESARRTVTRLELPQPDRWDFLVEQMGCHECFPDTRAALERLASRAPLWLLSNIDDDIMRETLKVLDSPIADTVTAEQVKSYKPAPAHFETALQRSGLVPEQILHVAFGFKYDIVPAARLGFRTAWINRAGDARPAEPTPDIELGDLRSLAELLVP